MKPEDIFFTFYILCFAVNVAFCFMRDLYLTNPLYRMIPTLGFVFFLLWFETSSIKEELEKRKNVEKKAAAH
jgi:hypothetical protein